MRGSAAGGSSPSASTIILTRATAAAVCCVKALTSSGHTQPGRSSGATSGKGSKSVLSKACWQTSETALKASEMARCLNLRRLSYVTLSPLRVSITSEYTSCRSSRYTSRKRKRVLSDISDSRVGLSFVISKSSSSPVGTPSLASWTLRTGLVGHSPPIKVAISCASAFGSLDFQFSSASGPRSSSFLTRPIAETGEFSG
mmetsp:Transcript_36436/g.108183  ORF Transcript_36436/g.108183 Transcript_36436/m.108183 type:complete len:200 (-) Transcript_36436:38-637(-)